MATDEDGSSHIPDEILGQHVAPFLDRITLNHLSLANTKVREVILHSGIHLPWPEKSFLVRWHACCLSFSPDGNILACGDREGVITMWDRIHGNRVAFLAPQTMHSRMFLAFSPDGRWLASGSEDSIYLWDPTDHHYFRRLTRDRDGDITCIAFSPEGQTIAAGVGDYGCIKLWSVEDGTCTMTLEGLDEDEAEMVDAKMRWSSLAFSPDGRSLASAGGRFAMLLLWDLSDGSYKTFAHDYGQIHPTTDLSSFVTFSSDGCLVSSDNEYIRFRRVSDCDPDQGDHNEAIIRSIKMRCNTNTEAEENISLNVNILSLSFSEDESAIASGHADNLVRLWNTEDGSPIGTCTYPGSVVAFAPDQRIFATLGSDRFVRVHAY
jgi:WD40 repeat protein